MRYVTIPSFQRHGHLHRLFWIKQPISMIWYAASSLATSASPKVASGTSETVAG
jgi:hypothetical protein